MLNSYLADLVLICHFCFILFVVFGGLLAWISNKIILLHIPAAIWGMGIEFFNWRCPLTPLENRLREAANRPGYNEGFIEHYLVPIIYPEALNREIQVILGSIVLLLNIAIYMSLIVRHRKT